MTLKKYREEYSSNKPKTIKDRIRNCLRCKEKFRTDKTMFMCHKFANRNGEYGI